MTQIEKFSNDELKKFRQILFPLISSGTITGYNHYPEKYTGKANYLIEYLHSNLGKYADGRDQEHKEELIGKIKTLCLTHLIESTTDKIIKRTTLYDLQPEWINNNLKLYDANGNTLSQDQAMIYDGTIIGEEKQHSLFIEINKREDLSTILSIFKQFTNKYKLDSSGQISKINGKKAVNLEAITDAWEIPVILITPNRKTKIETYMTINKISIDKRNSELSTLVKSTKRKLITELNNKNAPHKITKILANRLFHDWINEKK